MKRRRYPGLHLVAGSQIVAAIINARFPLFVVRQLFHDER